MRGIYRPLFAENRKGSTVANSREKGAVGERELADELNRLGMMARRSVQFCGATGEAADLLVQGLDLHVECKRCERIRMPEWVAQATRDAHGRPWVIVTRQSRQPWLVVQTLAQWSRDSMAAQLAMRHRAEVMDAAIRAQAARQDFPR